MSVFIDLDSDPGAWALALSFGNHSITVLEACASGRTGWVTATAAPTPTAAFECRFDAGEDGNHAAPFATDPFHHASGVSDA